MRVAAYIDGYNLYHAIVRFREPHLKWLDLDALCQVFVPRVTGTLVAVNYFSAYADWLAPQKARHETYVKALQATGVNVHLGNFKVKDRKCPSCNHRYTGHEEKETDVHLALSLLNDAYQDQYDRALIVTRDSDLVPAARLTKQFFPNKQIMVVAPPHLGHSNDMLKVCDGKHKIQRKHLSQCLLPATLTDADGNTITRPIEYTPPV